MSKARSRLVAEFVSGVLATACMSGLNAAWRRVKDPAGQRPSRGPKHYELVGQRLVQLARGDDSIELDEGTRRRLGEGLHFLFGGIMGIGFTRVVERSVIPAPLRGSAYGLALWAGAFLGYYPGMRIGPGAWDWGAEELTSTLRAHLVYGNSLMLLTRGWLNPDDRLR